MLRLGCDYNILIETTNKDYNVSTNYSVNGNVILYCWSIKVKSSLLFLMIFVFYLDCINGICSCYYEFYLPKVDKLSATVNPNKLATELKISFSYDNVPVINYHNESLNAIRLRYVLWVFIFQTIGLWILQFSLFDKYFHQGLPSFETGPPGKL